MSRVTQAADEMILVRNLRRIGAGLWWLACLVVMTADCQSYQPESVQDAINRVKEGKFGAVDVMLIANAHAVQAIPDLEQQFPSSKDVLLKDSLASALVRLGDKHEQYWNFLFDNAKAAIESDAPFPVVFDSAGKLVPRQLSTEFTHWAKVHQLSPNDAAAAQVYEIPGNVLLLAITGDSRGVLLLRKGMSSPNYYIQLAAAKGLAMLQDNPSVSFIIEACDKAPAEAKPMLAEPLVFFNDPRAQTAAERFISDRKTLEMLRKTSREKGPDGLFN
jgi:hypothetical protein